MGMLNLDSILVFTQKPLYIGKSESIVTTARNQVVKACNQVAVKA
mgnify:CR=1 FL=1